MNWVILVGLLGPTLALVGVIVSNYFARKREMEKLRKDRVTQAYAAYLDALSRTAGPRSNSVLFKMATHQQLDKDEMTLFEENNARVVNAHANVVIYGSKEVITALSDYYAIGSDFRDPVSRQAYVEVVKAMRHDSDAEDYGAFGVHVDNILISGPQRRQEVIAKNPALYQPKSQQPPPGSVEKA